MSEAPEFLPHGSLEAVPDVVDVIRRDNTDVTIASTTAETALFTFPVPAYMLDGDRGLRAVIRGERVNVSGGSVTYTFRIKLGATTLWEHSEAFVSSSAQCPLCIDIELFAKNSDAIQEMCGRFTISQASSPAVGLGGISAGGSVDAVIWGESAEDATTALDLTITVEMSVAHAAAIVAHRKSTVEHL